jgi:LysR family transcriptional regulator, benzoate and cis,cis-muconate-responsive activator of ben and cat genes
VLDLRRLRYFMAVASLGSFSRAADELHVAQSAVSRQVGLLERELGVKLLHRTTHDVALTEAGRHLLERGEALARDAEALWRDMRAFAAGERGRVSIGYSTSIGYETAPRLIGAAREALPDVAVSSVVLPSVELPGAVLNGPVDVALARCAADVDGIERTVVRRERLGALVPAGHPLAGRESADVADLRDDLLLLHDPAANPRHHALIVQVCRDAGFEPRLVPPTAPFDPAYATIARGEALSIVGESAQDGLPAAVVCTPLRTARRVEISLLMRAGERGPGVGRAVEAMLAEARRLGWV